MYILLLSTVSDSFCFPPLPFFYISFSILPLAVLSLFFKHNWRKTREPPNMFGRIKRALLIWRTRPRVSFDGRDALAHARWTSFLFAISLSVSLSRCSIPFLSARDGTMSFVSHSLYMRVACVFSVSLSSFSIRPSVCVCVCMRAFSMCVYAAPTRSARRRRSGSRSFRSITPNGLL